jgi:hypothetical protein
VYAWKGSCGRGSREPLHLAMRPANSGSVFPAVEHLTEIAMRRFMRSLVSICGLGPIWVYVLLPQSSVLTPSSRNIVTRKIAGGVGHPKQS